MGESIDQTVLQDISAARSDVLARIAAAAKGAGRDPVSVSLVAVSKVQPDERIDAMLAAGQRIYGENRVQEAEGRWAHRRAAYPDLELRLIGPLQSNKAKEAVALFDVIETLDREKPGGGAGGCVCEGGAGAASVCAGEYGRGRAEGGRGAA